MKQSFSDQVLEYMQKNCEPGGEWGEVYLDNMYAHFNQLGKGNTSVRGALAKLRAIGMYRPNGYAWGHVRLQVDQ